MEYGGNWNDNVFKGLLLLREESVTEDLCDCLILIN